MISQDEPGGDGAGLLWDDYYNSAVRALFPYLCRNLHFFVRFFIDCIIGECIE